MFPSVSLWLFFVSIATAIGSTECFNTSAPLNTMDRAARSLGKSLKIKLADVG